MILMMKSLLLSAQDGNYREKTENGREGRDQMIT